MAMQEMVIYGVSFDLVGKQPIVLLKTAQGNRFLPIWVGHNEAAAILTKLQGGATPRPMTHDLLTNVLAELEAKVERISVTDLKESTFYAVITLTPSILVASSGIRDIPCAARRWRSARPTGEAPRRQPRRASRAEASVLGSPNRSMKPLARDWSKVSPVS